MTILPTVAIAADPDCQPRIAIAAHIVDDYATDMAVGARFPPITVYHDGETYWLADGFHRLAAALRLGLAEIDCDVRDGDKRAAILYSCAANATHGTRRTNQDKRRAVEAMLKLEPTWGNRAIADACLVTHTFVNNLSKSLETVSDDSLSNPTSHRARFKLPDMTPTEYAVLKASIAESGVLVPIEVDQNGEILDGHHRVRAWKELCAEGVKIPEYARIIRHFDDDDSRIEHTLRLNCLRRDTGPENHPRIAKHWRARGWTDEQIADALSVDVAIIRYWLAESSE